MREPGANTTAAAETAAAVAQRLGLGPASGRVVVSESHHAEASGDCLIDYFGDALAAIRMVRVDVQIDL